MPAFTGLFIPVASAEFPGTVETYLLEVFAEGNPQAAISPVEHLTGHEGVEDGRAHQRHAEVEAEEPPVLHVLVKLFSEEKGRWDCAAACPRHPLCLQMQSRVPSLTAGKNLHYAQYLFYFLALDLGKFCTLKL